MNILEWLWWYLVEAPSRGLKRLSARIASRRRERGWDTEEGHAILREAAVEQTGEIPNLRVILGDGTEATKEEIERAAEVVEGLADGLRANERRRIDRQLRRYAKRVRSGGEPADVIAAAIIVDVAGRLITGDLAEV
ncbi:hypothetical protein [Plantactinospora sp. WMMB782]|uniref:hypothetical protein n=1 Tax=Plantactinospora sp. WMMB782 TaxID=3404121 RepID=UPI003B943088